MPHLRPSASTTPTAGPASRSRGWLSLTLTWLTIAAALSLFTSTVVANAGMRGKPDYGAAVKELPPAAAAVVVVASDDPGDGFLERMLSRSGNHVVCSVTRGQLAQLESRYAVGRLTVSVDGSEVDVVTVAGANEGDVRSLLGGAPLTCTLVKEKHVFFLPFDAHTS